MKPKFRMSVDEMLEFNDDCNNAANTCPQYRNNWLIEDRDICLGKIKAKDLLKHWLKCSTLWESGYSECLSLDSLETIKEYKTYKSKLKLYKLNKGVA